MLLERKQEFLKDIEKCTNESIVDVIREHIEDEINLYAVEGDKLYKDIYHYADLYNSLNVAKNRILEKEKIKEDKTEEVEL